MKKLAVFLCVVAFAVAVPSLRAETGGRILEVHGDVTVVLPGGDKALGVTSGVDVEEGAVLVAAAGAHVRVSLPGIGEIRLTGPAAMRLDRVDGVPVLTLLRGTAAFAYGSGDVRLAVQGGQLAVSGVNGRSATLAAGTEIAIAGGASAPRVTVRSGTALFSGDREHVLLRDGDSREFGARRAGARGLLLSGRGLDLQLPTEVLHEQDGDLSPALAEFADAWNRNRESPRIP